MTSVNQEVQSGTKQKSLVRRISGELTLTNSVKRMFSAPIEGAEVVKGTASAVYEGFSSANDEVRNESFEQACDRLGVAEHDLALIHNQLVFQLYLTFFAGLAALTVFLNSLLMNSGWMIILASVAGASACFANSMQSSLQAYRVRLNDLCEFDVWLSKPSEWLPSRLPIKSELSPGDSRLDPGMWRASVKRARRFFVSSMLVFVCGLVGFIFRSGGGLNTEYGALCLSLMFAVLGAKYSALALESSQKRALDFSYWLHHPRAWWPSMPKSRRMVGQKSPSIASHQDGC